MPADPDILLPSDQQPVVLYHRQAQPERLECLAGVAVFSGAFNPLHVGHCQLKQVAEDLLQCPVYYELSLANVAKAQLDGSQLKSRLQQFAGTPTAVTHAAKFADKARLFPGCCFVVGFDTAVRVLAPEFYGHCATARDHALAALADAGHRFLVAGRLDPHSRQFLVWQSTAAPSKFRHLFVAIEEHQFRLDISSTQIRQAGAAMPDQRHGPAV
jgi:hypothetical protein